MFSVKVVLFSVLTLTALSVAPGLSAAPAKHLEAKTSGHGQQKAKFKGTLLSISHDGTNVKLTLSGGVTMTLPENAVTVVDHRSHKSTPSSVARLAADMHVVVKTHMDKSGKVTEAKIKITS